MEDKKKEYNIYILNYMYSFCGNSKIDNFFLRVLKLFSGHIFIWN